MTIIIIIIIIMTTIMIKNVISNLPLGGDTISMCGLVDSNGGQSFGWLLKKPSGGRQQIPIHL